MLNKFHQKTKNYLFPTNKFSASLNYTSMPSPKKVLQTLLNINVAAKVLLNKKILINEKLFSNENA